MKTPIILDFFVSLDFQTKINLELFKTNNKFCRKKRRFRNWVLYLMNYLNGTKIKIPSEIYQPLIDLSSEPDKNMPGWAAQGTCIHSTLPLWPRRVASQRPVFKHHNFNVSSYEPLITNPENQNKTNDQIAFSKLWFFKLCPIRKTRS